MSVKHYIDTSSQIIITTWDGDAVDIDFIEAIQKYQKDIQTNTEYKHYNELVNFSNTKSIKLTTEGIMSLGKIAASTDQSENAKKLGFVVRNNLAFGLVRMYQAYRSFEKNSNKEIRVFKSEKEALDWVSN